MTAEEAFDTAEALYWFCADYHGGQSSYLYECLSRLSLTFKPGILSRGPSTEESKEIYDTIVTIHETIGERAADDKVESLMTELTGVI